MKLKQGIGSSFDDFLQEEGMLAEAEAIAVKRVIAFQIEETMSKEHITKTEMAKRMNNSRSAINRLLDPLNTSITGVDPSVVITVPCGAVIGTVVPAGIATGLPMGFGVGLSSS